jgi:hypothetical protein
LPRQGTQQITSATTDELVEAQMNTACQCPVATLSGVTEGPEDMIELVKQKPEAIKKKKQQPGRNVFVQLGASTMANLQLTYTPSV